MIKHRKKSSVTAQDVALRAGVSRAAVSRTFTNNGSVAKHTREKVLQAANELGYQVNFLAQGLNRKRSQLIGVVVARLSDPFRSGLLEGLLLEIQRQGYQAMVTEVRNADGLEETIRRFTQFRVSGVIVTSGQPPSELVNECVQHNIPVVGINRQMDIKDVDFVCSDNKAGAALAAQQLLESGCKQLAWLNYKDSTWGGINRGECFKHAIDQHQLQALELLAEQDGYQGGRQAAHQLCASQNWNIDGVFCANAQLACGFLDGMREQGFSAPQDFHLIGFDDTELTGQYSYQLTTIRQNIDLIAKQAVLNLQARGRDNTAKQRFDLVPVTLTLRATSPALTD
ncbi:LacI family DNA-binding transcriptional regulator [Marinomonas sp.]